MAPPPWAFHHPPGMAPAPRPVASTRVAGTSWLEVRTDTGQKFWHNDATGQGTWECPPEVRAASSKRPAPPSLDPTKAAMLERARAAGAVVAPQFSRTTKAGEGAGGAAGGDFDDDEDVTFTEEDIQEADQPSGKQRQQEPAHTAQPDGGDAIAPAIKIDPEEAFKALLAEKGVHSFSRYERELPKIQTDPRFIRVPAARRRRLFEEYCAAAGQATKKGKAAAPKAAAGKASPAESKAAEDAFRALLQERVTQSSVQWRTARGDLSRDARFSEVAEAQRETLFRAHTEALRRAEHARERAESRARHERQAA